VIWGAKASLRWRFCLKRKMFSASTPSPDKPAKALYHFTESDFWLNPCHVSFLRKPPVCGAQVSAAAPLLVPQGDNRVYFGSPPRRNISGQECHKPNQQNGGQKDGAALTEWQEIVVNEA
jgi:hypothetical protein